MPTGSQPAESQASQQWCKGSSGGSKTLHALQLDGTRERTPGTRGTITSTGWCIKEGAGSRFPSWQLICPSDCTGGEQICCSQTEGVGGGRTMPKLTDI
mmetsp:Transcript_60675/g.120142  ORF Transcript_60675/g.120142 Transcript_60675/m.120142 type:complete len:99 (+) Transcript_60675:2193-2489(+)